MNTRARPYPRPTAQVAPYVEALGFDLAIAFLLRFGGAEMYVADTPRGRSEAEALLGEDACRALGAVAHRLPKRVPLAKTWLALCLQARGLSVAEIARTLRVTDVTVRRMLTPVAAKADTHWVEL